MEEGKLKLSWEWLRVWGRETAETGAEDWIEEELEEAEEGTEHDRLADQQV